MITKSLDMGTWNQKLGHVSDDVVKMSLPHILGIGRRETNNLEEVCQPCRLGEATRNTRKPIGMCRNKTTKPIER